MEQPPAARDDVFRLLAAETEGPVSSPLLLARCHVNWAFWRRRLRDGRVRGPGVVLSLGCDSLTHRLRDEVVHRPRHGGQPLEAPHQFLELGPPRRPRASRRRPSSGRREERRSPRAARTDDDRFGRAPGAYPPGIGLSTNFSPPGLTTRGPRRPQAGTSRHLRFAARKFRNSSPSNGNDLPRTITARPGSKPDSPVEVLGSAPKSV